MASNLKNRLQRIRTMTQTKTEESSRDTIMYIPVNTSIKTFMNTDKDIPIDAHENLTGFGAEWISVGFKFLKRSIISTINFDIPHILPDELKVLVPDFMRFNRKSITPEELLFFDLETTGLSGGAGTVAFLAAIGFFVPSKEVQSYKLKINQYLLLDYPGEADFLEMIIPILNDEKKVIVTYNGKTFDTKLFRTRCLMNGMKPPIYEEADLLHPARRLWKTILPNCSQAEIETSILGLDRSGDISGAFAPQIWFDFLNNQNPQDINKSHLLISDLLSICDHNKKDIEGLASIFSLITKISANPIEVSTKHLFDIETAALRFRDLAKFFPDNQLLKKQAERLINYCIEKKLPKAMYFYAQDLFKKGFHDESILLFKNLLEMEIPFSLRISVLNNIAIDAEWRLKDCIQALNYVELILQIEHLSETFRKKVLQRRERLLKKLFF